MLKETTYFVIGIIIFIVLCFGVYYAYTSNSPRCDYKSEDKVYVTKEKGCVINFLCTSDKVPFSDECGCGCRLANQTG